MNFARERQAVAGRPRGAGAEKKSSRGTTVITTTAGKNLEAYSEKIADSLLRSLMGGNATGAKLLFALAEGRIDCEDEVVMRQVYSLAEKLELEAPWTGTAVEAESESDLEEQEKAA
jgi:hypothetical protein